MIPLKFWLFLSSMSSFFSFCFTCKQMVIVYEWSGSWEHPKTASAELLSLSASRRFGIIFKCVLASPLSFVHISWSDLFDIGEFSSARQFTTKPPLHPLLPLLTMTPFTKEPLLFSRTNLRTIPRQQHKIDEVNPKFLCYFEIKHWNANSLHQRKC